MAKVLDEVRRDRATGKPVKAYVVRWKEPGGKQRERTFRLKREAATFAANIDTEISRGAYRDPSAGRITLAAFIADHLANLSVSPGTMDKYRVIANRHVIPALGKYPLNTLRRSHIQSWVKGLSDSGLAVSTVNNTYKVLAGGSMSPWGTGLSARIRANG